MMDQNELDEWLKSKAYAELVAEEHRLNDLRLFGQTQTSPRDPTLMRGTLLVFEPE